MRRWWCCAAVVLACGDDGDEGQSTVGSTDTGSMTLSSSATESDASSGNASSSGVADTSGGVSSSDDGGTTEAPFIVCADIVCGPGEICITPCCGGPAPGCGPAPAPSCLRGTHPVDACPFGGCESMCCEDDPCVPEFPYCIGMEEVACMKDRNSPNIRCSIEDCFGELVEGIVSCECA